MQPSNPQSSAGTALVSVGQNFTSFLSSLTRQTFRLVASEFTEKLRTMNQTLALLEATQEGAGFDGVLHEMLTGVSLKTGELLHADRTTVFLLDKEKNELWSVLARADDGKLLEFRFPATVGIAGQAATTREIVNIPFDFYDDPRSTAAKEFDRRNGYRTYTMLTLPLLDEAGELVGVVQLLNKLREHAAPESFLADRIDPSGFTESDIEAFLHFAPLIRQIIEASQSFYRATQKQRAASALMKAINSLSRSSLDLEETLAKVMAEARELMKADRSTLWLLDEEKNQLWTKLPINDKLTEIRIPRTAGFAGRVATTGEPLNIPYDLYDDPNSETSRETDRKTGYRTCSLLCMPVFNADGRLIGVTQLINKIKPGDHPSYDASKWPEAPECWRASFQAGDLEFMQAFNLQAGIAIQNAKLFAVVKQQAQMQRDMLRSLSDAVISTDKQGRVTAANEAAKRLLGREAGPSIEGDDLRDLICLKDSDFAVRFAAALTGRDEKSRRQYYPEQVLISGNAQNSVNLSLNSIADVEDTSNVIGALVVLEDISDEKRLKSTMYRYMTQELVERLLQSGDDAKLGGDRKEVTILFSDIRGYTSLTENLEAEEVVRMLNEYFESMVEAVFRYKGTLDKYIGDAIMAVFGSPFTLEDHAWCAVRAAIDMRRRLIELNAERKAEGKSAIKIGIGINTDTVISGNIGSSKRMEFTAIGDGVNLGSRLESASKFYGCDIIISENTYRPCADRVWARELDRVRVKGKNEPVSIYELVELREGTNSLSVAETKLKIIEHYEKARKHFVNREFGKAHRELVNVLQIDPNDKPSLLHKERCWHFMSSPPPDDWDGVWVLTEK